MSPTFKLPGGGIAIACIRGRKPKPRPVPCVSCGLVPHAVLCDGPGAERGTTCDAQRCRDCSVRVGQNRDLCAEHWLLQHLGLPGALVFYGLLAFELRRRCCHGRWDPSIDPVDGPCIYCDSGQST